MSELNKTYRIKTNIGDNLENDFITLTTDLVQDYEVFDILSVKINSTDLYKLHNSNYGVVVGRVLANNGFGVPNAKLSVFIEADSYDGEKMREIYPFISTYSKDANDVKYNLLPDNKVADCHQIVGTFPNKRYLLDNENIIEVFDKYYKYTTRTNNSGDYLIMGVPVGSHVLHMDLDLSDCGILSQRPRDFVYKGYTIEQFENPNKFKEGHNFEELSQIFTQDQTINVQPFWGNESLGEKIGLTRVDMKVAFTFQPTCVFMGSIASDSASQGITKKCMATENMGNMEELITGEGTIEMIRKTPSGDIEEFQVRGTQLINSNGVWCYQIPMNLDYMMTDEYGNMVPTDDPSKGIPTRCSARFRISMQDNEENVDNFFRAKVLVPHNPQNISGGTHEDYDYEFGSKTRDDSFRDLFWNNVYTVKSYIPRFQKRRIRGWKDKRFTGIKNCNFFGSNNPIPYNNIRIKLPLMFTILCALIKCFIYLTGIFNTLISMLGNFLSELGAKRIDLGLGKIWLFPRAYESALELKLNVLSEGLCPDLENWFFAPMLKDNLEITRKGKQGKNYNILKQTLDQIKNRDAFDDVTSIEYTNKESEEDTMCITTKVDYLISCVEMNLAMEHRVINFDFYNDWINGLIYIPRFMRFVRPKKTFLGITIAKTKVKGCMDNTRIFGKTRRYTQQCAMGYRNKSINNSIIYTNVENPLGKGKNKKHIKKANNLHKNSGFTQKSIFGRSGGICHEHITSKGHNVYYMKPCEWVNNNLFDKAKANLFATDLVLLGTLNDCDSNGIPQAFKYLSSTSYIMPTNLALTNMETNGPLYANDKNTICAGSSDQILDEEKLYLDNGVQDLTNELGLSGEIKYYQDAKDVNTEISYDLDELSDIIALTEAAGISWNYTGPGQGKEDPKQMYHPGGHFLGLTCNNAQTNIKSCINLERICEVGANLSQRKEDVRKVDEDGNLLYTYIAPTGFISGDDIVAEDFRSMFSTMNQTRLIAKEIDPSTGYKMYDIKYRHPINFDGAFKNVVDGSNNTYNSSDISVPGEDDNIFKSVGIETNNNKRLDHDVDESHNTITKTIEDASLDYYLFRFGLSREECVKNGEMQLRRFLLNKDNRFYLPQYENSYYFYFGMKDGASAIDEFNKQFFSVCETESINIGDPDVVFNLKKYNLCEGLEEIEVIIKNMELPINKISYIDNRTLAEDILDIDDGSKYSYTIDLPTGDYTFTIIDAEGISIKKQLIIPNNILDIDVKKQDFNTIKNITTTNILSSIRNNILGDDETSQADIITFGARVDNSDECLRRDRATIEARPENCDNDCTINRPIDNDVCATYGGCHSNYDEEDIKVPAKPTIIYDDVDLFYRGGYFSFENLKINEEYKNSIEKINIIITTNEIYDVNDSDNTKIFTIYSEQTNNSNITVELDKANIIYYIFLSYKCNNINKWVTIYKDSFLIKDGSYLSLNLGWENIGLYLTVSSNDENNNDLLYGDDTWWKRIDRTDSDSNVVKTKDWIKKMCLLKETSDSKTFSNNLFTINGKKVIWGTPQNEDGVYSSTTKHIYNSEEEIPDNYTLDDDFTYFSTIPATNENSNYSAVAVDGTMVAGDFWAYLENGVRKWRVGNNLHFPQYSGYVFKPLPEGDLQFHVYEGENGEVNNLKYYKYVDIDGKGLDRISVSETQFKEKGGTIIKDGLFYPSFIYPVASYPFELDLDFYVWNRQVVYQEEGSDIKKYRTTTFAGRTEMRLYNGITYDDNFSEIIVSNINREALKNDIQATLKYNKDSNIFYGEEYGDYDRINDFVGTNPHVISYDFKTDEENIDDNQNINMGGYITGISGISEMYYSYIGGLPSNGVILSGNTIIDSNTQLNENCKKITTATLGTLVTNFSNNFTLDDIFSKSIGYKISKGKYVFYRDLKEYDFKKEKNYKTRLFICEGSDLLTETSGNSNFVYYMTGEKHPKYWVLCRYNRNQEEQEGDYVLLNINFTKNKVFTYSLPYINFGPTEEEEKETDKEEDSTVGQEVFQSGKIKNGDIKDFNLAGIKDIDDVKYNLHNLIRVIKEKEKNKDEEKKTYLKADPVKIRDIKPRGNEKWLTTLQSERRNISDEGNINIENPKNIYAVEFYDGSINENNSVGLYKIFPLVEELIDEKYEIDLFPDYIDVESSKTGDDINQLIIVTFEYKDEKRSHHFIIDGVEKDLPIPNSTGTVNYSSNSAYTYAINENNIRFRIQSCEYSTGKTIDNRDNFIYKYQIPFYITPKPSNDKEDEITTIKFYTKINNYEEYSEELPITRQGGSGVNSIALKVQCQKSLNDEQSFNVVFYTNNNVVIGSQRFDNSNSGMFSDKFTEVTLTVDSFNTIISSVEISSDSETINPSGLSINYSEGNRVDLPTGSIFTINKTIKFINDNEGLIIRDN